MNKDDLSPLPVTNFGLDCNSQSSLYNKPLYHDLKEITQIDTNKNNIFSSPNDLLQSTCLATDQATPLPSVTESGKERSPDKEDQNNAPSEHEVGSQDRFSVLSHGGHELADPDSREQHEKRYNYSNCLPSVQVIENGEVSIVPKNNIEDGFLQNEQFHKNNLTGTEQHSGVELPKELFSIKSNDSSFLDVLKNRENCLILDRNNEGEVSQQEQPNEGVLDHFTFALNEEKELPLALQESVSIETDNNKSLYPLEDYDRENKSIIFSIPPSEIIKSDCELPIKKSLPLVCELETSVISSKANPRTLEVTGLQHTANLQSLSLAKTFPKPHSVQQHVEGFILEKSKNVIIGTGITTEDLTINQYVDLSNLEHGIPQNSQVTVTDSSKSESCCSKLRIFWATLLLGSMITAAVTGASLAFLDTLPASQEDVPDNNGDMSTNYTLRLITRGQWSQHADVKIDNLPYRPTPYVVVCHTAGHFCTNTAVCVNVIRGVESWNINSGSLAIGYNFLIAGDGFIYEGRGWKKQGAHTLGINCKSIGIGFVGNFNSDKLLPSMVEAYNILMAEGVRRKELTPDYKVVAANQIKTSDSPGLNICEIIKTWPHWGPFTKNDTKCK